MGIGGDKALSCARLRIDVKGPEEIGLTMVDLPGLVSGKTPVYSPQFMLKSV